MSCDQVQHCALQSGDEKPVSEAAHATGGVDAYDPQSAEFALFHPAIAERVDAAAHQRHLGLTPQMVPTEAKSLCQFAHSRPFA